MLHEFLSQHRGEVLTRCQAKVRHRHIPAGATDERDGVGIFLDELGRALRGRPLDAPWDISTALEPAQGGHSALVHGQQMQEEGYTVEQVVHHYGDLCQAITELVREHNLSIDVVEFQVLNGLLDSAIARAVSSFVSHRNLAVSSEAGLELHQRLGTLGDEQRRLVTIALSAVDALKGGNIGIMGATGALLEDSLLRLRDLIDRQLPQLRLRTGIVTPPEGAGDR